jgi:hypothetical protein
MTRQSADPKQKTTWHTQNEWKVKRISAISKSNNFQTHVATISSKPIEIDWLIDVVALVQPKQLLFAFLAWIKFLSSQPKANLELLFSTLSFQFVDWHFTLNLAFSQQEQAYTCTHSTLRQMHEFIRALQDEAEHENDDVQHESASQIEHLLAQSFSRQAQWQEIQQHNSFFWQLIQLWQSHTRFVMQSWSWANSW